MGSSRRIWAQSTAISLAGKASGAGLPAEKEITLGSEECLRISRITEGLRVDIRSEKVTFMTGTSFLRQTSPCGAGFFDTIEKNQKKILEKIFPIAFYFITKSGNNQLMRLPKGSKTNKRGAQRTKGTKWRGDASGNGRAGRRKTGKKQQWFVTKNPWTGQYNKGSKKRTGPAGQQTGCKK